MSVPGPQRRALAVTLLREEPGGRPPEQGAIAVAFLTLLRTIAARGPTLLAVDDVQWLDTATEAPLRFVLRRLDPEAVGVLLAHRAEKDGPIPLGLDRLGPHRFRVLRLGELSVGALGRILHERLGITYPRPTLLRLHEFAGGNPFFAIELARAFTSPPRPLRPGAALPVPMALHELVGNRLIALPDETLHALTVASALSRPRLELISAVLERDSTPLFTPAIAAHVAVVDAGTVRFAHPLLAAAAYDLAGSKRLLVIHRRIAGVVEDVEERARHLALATVEPDNDVAQIVEEAGAVALARGSPAAAAELLEEAQRLTGLTASADRARRAGNAGWYWFVAGDSARARALLEDSLTQSPPGRDRVHALTRLGRFHYQAGDRRAAAGLYRKALQEGGDDPALAAEAHEGLAWSIHLLRENAALAAHHARAAVELAKRVGDTGVLVDALVVQAQCEFFMGGGLPSPAMESAFAVRADPSEIRVLRRPDYHWAMILLSADDFDPARKIMLETRELAVTHGDETALPWVLMRLSQLELLAGNWALAAEYASAGSDVASQAGQRPLQADLLCTRALLMAHRGEAALARNLAAEGLSAAQKLGTGIGTRLAPWALGLLELSLGDAESTRRQLEPLRRDSERAQIVDPGENRYLPDLVEALVSLDQLDEADELLASYAERAREVARGSALAAASRCRGLLAAARGETDGALASLEEAVTFRVPVAFERGRTLLALGAQQRRVRERRAAARPCSKLSRSSRLSVPDSGPRRHGPSSLESAGEPPPGTNSPPPSSGSQHWRPRASRTRRSPRSSCSRFTPSRAR